MRWKYRLWYFIIFVVHFFCWYYALCFCAVYNSSSNAWIIGCLTSLAIDLLGIQIAAPLLKGILREFIRKFPNRLFIWAFEKYDTLVSYVGC